MAEPFPAPYVDLDDIEHDHEIAMALGNMVVAWTHAETMLVMTLARITSMDRNRATIGYYRIPTFEARIKFLRAILIDWKDPEYDNAAIDRAIIKLSGLSRARNHWIHCVWSRHKQTGETVIFDFRSPDGSKDRCRPVNAAAIKNHVDAVHRRTDDLIAAIRYATLP